MFEKPIGCHLVRFPALCGTLKVQYRCSLNDAVCQMSPIHRLAVCFQFRLTPGIVCVLLKSSMRAIVSLMEIICS
jgi:hypothetical protein